MKAPSPPAARPPASHDLPAEEPAHRPFVPDEAQLPEFTWPAVTLGAILGIIFGASSLYLVLKVGMTVSASIPVAVLSITLFRACSRAFGIRQATILENNIVQTTGSAGESIAFGVGVTIPALMLLGFDMHLSRVLTVAACGGLLGILMMIPLRRAFIVRQHGKLPYPEGTACAEVLIVGEQGGATAKTVFAGFGLALLHKFATTGLHLWSEMPGTRLYSASGGGLKGAEIGGELSPELLGVGYIIGPRVASIMFGGGVLAYLVLAPLIVYFGAPLAEVLAPGQKLISEMSVKDLRNAYILYIGAGAVATGGLISMLRAMPLIVGSIRAGLADLSTSGGNDKQSGRAARTSRDLPLKTVFIGCALLILALAASPDLGLGFNPRGLVGAALIVLLGFLFVTVSSRLTGEIGSSSNPISGMTVATLLITCLVYVLLEHNDKEATLSALSVAAVVCIAASNAGTTSQDLKTGYLVGSTPRDQQLAILVGALTSAAVIGFTLLLLNGAGTVYTQRAEYLPDYRVPDVSALTQMERPGGTYAGQDTHEYHVWHATEGEVPGVPQGRYLVDDEGRIRYLVDPAIEGRVKRNDNGAAVPKFDAPKTRLMAVIIDGIMNRRLPWGLVIIGALIAVTLELAGVPSLPFAVGVYLPIQISVPIFIGGAARWLVDRFSGKSIAESETSPGILLSSGYIAGGSIAGVLVAFLAFAPEEWVNRLNLGRYFSESWQESSGLAIAAFGVLLIVLLLTGFGQLLRGNNVSSHT